uniref:Cas10/Cmr2 second palm domain-containing protein n=1 Tax=Roseivirga sp. TaxID=1964215 RepID=UPI004048C4A9
MNYAYLAEIKGIQAYLTASGKLRDTVAGSQILDQLLNNPLDHVLQAANSTKHVFTRRVGGALYMSFPNETTRANFAALWRIVVNQLLPNTELVVAMPAGQATLREAIKSGLEQLASARNQQIIHLPVGTPFTQRCPRTGLPSTTKRHGEWMSEPASVQLESQSIAGKDSLTEKFCAKNDLKWPNLLSSDTDNQHGSVLPLGMSGELAVVHADGNSLGIILRALAQATEQSDDEAYQQAYLSFSEGLEKATIQAAKQATNEVFGELIACENSIMPMRPIVLGGDDLTVIIRAENAFAFAKAFMTSFEQESKTFITNLINDCKLTLNLTHLTACAGITFIKPNQPFSQALDLAETLCKRAKQAPDINNKPSALAFARLNSSGTENGGITGDINDSPLQSEQVRYPLNGDNGSFDQLQTLANEQTVNLMPLREIATLMGNQNQTAKINYERWRQHQSQLHTANFDSFYDLLKAFVSDDELPICKQEHVTTSPIVDLLVLRKYIAQEA